MEEELGLEGGGAEQGGKPLPADQARAVLREGGQQGEAAGQ